MADINDILKKVDSIAKKLLSDNKLLSLFKSDPVKLLESKFGINLPDEQINKVVTAIKAKLTADKATDLVEDLKDDSPAEALGKLGDLFGKK